MKRLNYLTHLLLYLLVFVYGCTEFLSQSVDELFIPINSPIDSLYSRPDEVTFWWEDDRRAEKYRFQLVSPNFDNPFVILDTTLTDNRLSILLTEGVYTWRIRAENEGSKSIYQQRVFVLDDTSPYGATASHPRNMDSLSIANYDFRLRWGSNDQPIDGFSFEVSDSLFLYSWKDSVLILVGEYDREETEAREVDVSGEVSGILPGESLNYRWLVKTFDQAGNAKVSQTFEFLLRE